MGGQRTLHCKNHIKASERASPADIGGKEVQAGSG